MRMSKKEREELTGSDVVSCGFGFRLFVAFVGGELSVAVRRVGITLLSDCYVGCGRGPVPDNVKSGTHRLELNGRRTSSDLHKQSADSDR